MKIDPTLKVVARIQKAALAKQADYSEGKMLAHDGSWRLTWTSTIWEIEELPMKGKKTLRIAKIQNLGQWYHLHSSAFHPENIMQAAKISSGLTYDQVKDKIQAELLGPSLDTFFAEVPEEKRENFDYLRKVAWSEQSVNYLKVTPENVEPFIVDCQDCKIKVSWTDFIVYPPNAYMQISDPHYRVLSASTPAAARKLYQMLKVKPDALKSVPYDKLDEFFKANKIGFKTD